MQHCSCRLLRAVDIRRVRLLVRRQKYRQFEQDRRRLLKRTLLGM